ncbi:MAG: hypothetical protein QOG34_543, partial [Frankiaceae bacterium]|nr:hypothetical protein [Frankiaceae bacterium]
MTLLDALAAAVGPEHVVTDRSVLASYETDWTGRFTGRALAAVRPRDTAQVAGVVTASADAEVPLCIQGGNTGLVGGSIPVDGAVLLSLARLDEIGEVDPVAAQVTVGVGVTLARLQQHVRPLGLDFGVDFAARESCTIGGMAATNAGGERVLRYGTMRAQVLGVEAVLADGTVVSRLGGLPKDNTGYDVVSLMVGAEGTLGVLTRLRLRLVPLLNGRAVALIAVDDTEAAVRLVRQARDELPSLEAAELIFADGVELVRRHTGLPAPFADAHPAYLLLECAHRDDPSDGLLALLEASTDVRDATVATDARGRHA